ncbi:copper chaperone PCu(A)C [Roseateles chitosanitabidus]|uniref:copper chaperone PCu(A)C n=1 Tax=Roseateles chitosanitabidus TaxID=65048 RepID=UPI00082E775D|nr:copper chaperone PCu(A)C [Roseateles chitosanitabidus]MBO9689575.1 copper chaperone PCu(A)C [Roseateles chitosanitabidus]
MNFRSSTSASRPFSIASLARAALPALLLCAGLAQAQVVVTGQWVRATVAQQKATGAFMQIKSPTAVKLVSVSTPVAEVAEVHEMAMDGSVMRMRPVSALDIPAGQTVELKPGGYHVMLMKLKAPIADGETVPLTLVFEGADKMRMSVQVQAAARSPAAAAAAASEGAKDMHGGHGDHKH